ncbi:MAG: hypothetical protein KatS3mg105_1018 [Gemmatales bacterium]|nr:MAG: hypothetical protein KatS3mg105_1018 [Gemmatales bacterium]
MTRRSTTAIVIALLATPTAVNADALESALALQKAFEEAIDKVEPSIACILVSRSDVYQRWFGQTYSASDPGRLGEFHSGSVSLRVPPGDEERIDALRRQLAKKLGMPIQRVTLAMLFDLSQPGYVPESYGSGVVIDANGLILTNYHVVRGARKIFVRLPGEIGSYADIYGADPRSDLAVLRLLDGRVGPLKPIRFGDGGKVKKGHLVLSIANPFAAGFRDGSPSASWGMISNVRRRHPGVSVWEQDRAKWTIHDFGTLLQADPRLNLGCSGGALINLKGEMIGLTTALAAISNSETAGGYAFPLDDVLKRIIGVLAQGKEVNYGFLGVRLETQQNSTQVQVLRHSAAERGGIRNGDTILAIDDVPIRDSEDLFYHIGTKLAGNQARIKLRSINGIVRTVTVTLDKFYVPGPFIAANKPKPVFGLRVDYTSVLCQRTGLAEVPVGVYVSEVVPGSPADRARLQDAVIVKVNGKLVTNPDEFYRAVGDGPVVLSVVDHNEPGGLRTIKFN